MSQSRQFSAVGCAFVLAGLLGGASSAMAQTDVTPRSPAQTLACLQRPAKVPAYPQRSDHDRGQFFMRVKLRFEAPNAPPKLEMLANTAGTELQELVRDYLDGYRLPCLSPADGAVEAVQEFDLYNSSLGPLALDRPGRRQFCIVVPPRDIEAPLMLGLDTEHVVATAVFSGDGDQAPEVKIIHTTGDARLDRLVREHVSAYRMPCRKSGQEAQTLQQQFSFVPPQGRRYVLKKDAFELRAFLGMVGNLDQHRANFSLDTMNCPFQARYTVYGPSLPNHVVEVGPKDINRVAFLRWLEKLNLAFTNERQANSLFGTTMLIDVPCGLVQLQQSSS